MEAPAAVIPAFVALARHIAIVVLTPRGTVIAATEAAERLLASPASAMVGRAWTELCSDAAANVQEYLDQCARTLAPIPGAFRREIKGESTRFRCEGYATMLSIDPTRAVVLQIRRQDKQDSFIMLGQKIEELNTEILRRRDSEKRLAEAESRLKAVLDQMPAGVVIAEAPSGRTIYANREAQEIFGGPIVVADQSRYTEEFRSFHPGGRAFDPEDYPFARALLGETVVGQEIHFLRAGEPAVVRVNAAPIRDAAGNIIAAVTAHYDITEQKRLEELTLVARADAERANRAKDEFLAMLGHELRNPLAPIITALDLMQLRGAGAEKERSIIDRQVKHLVRLVDDLLDISRFATGKIELKRERIELGAIVARAVEMSSPLLENRAHGLHIDVPGSNLVVDADPARLAQVVSNILTNAAKYSERTSPIWMTAGREHDQVVLRIRDAGIGIASDVLPRIFDRFVQEKHAIDRSQGGLGLGLAIVHSLVGLHGGTVDARSDGPGRGSEFVVRLPAVDEPAATIPTIVERAGGAPARSGGLRVLVVDDNEDGAEMLSETLLAMGHTTRIAYDGPGALRVIEEFVPQLAVLDIGLPVMDGYELAQRLREQPGLHELRLIAVTAYGQVNDRARSRIAGFDAHLVKPVSSDHLSSIVEGLARRNV